MAHLTGPALDVIGSTHRLGPAVDVIGSSYGTAVDVIGSSHRLGSAVDVIGPSYGTSIERDWLIVQTGTSDGHDWLTETHLSDPVASFIGLV